ncbi:MAG: hypothetical protein KatS3mg052_2966 [Candidatus Roseilinea sp.]|nr:MAG: hypothetical protein KatS3mg052_2966 [Candidatus Roseilinea sp.]
MAAAGNCSRRCAWLDTVDGFMSPILLPLQKKSPTFLRYTPFGCIDFWETSIYNMFIGF